MPTKIITAGENKKQKAPLEFGSGNPVREYGEFGSGNPVRDYGKVLVSPCREALCVCVGRNPTL